MAGDQVPTAPTNDDGVPMMLRLNLQHRTLGEVVQAHATFNLRLRDVPVHLITEVGMRDEKVCLLMSRSFIPLPFVFVLDAPKSQKMSLSATWPILGAFAFVTVPKMGLVKLPEGFTNCA